MPRIDPLQLLTCLGVLLKPNGGIKGKEEVAKLASLMTKFSKKLVSKCIYVQILQVTEPGLLDLFMASGGWQLTHMWLSDAVEVYNWPLIKELVDLLMICPVTVDRLRENTNAKILKGLSKDAEDECVREKATQLVSKWTQVIKEETKDNKNMVKAGSDDKDIKEESNCDSADVQVAECDVVRSGKKMRRKSLGKRIRKRTKRMMNLRDDSDENEDEEDKNEKENGESKCGTSEDIRISEETRSQWKSLTPEMRALPVYKIMIRDGKQVLAKVTSGFRAAMKAEDVEPKDRIDSAVESVSIKTEPKTEDSETSQDRSSASDSKPAILKTIKSEPDLGTVSTATENLDACVKKESDSENEGRKVAIKKEALDPKESTQRKTRGRTSSLKDRSFELALKNIESISSEDSSVLSDRESGKQYSSSSGVKSDRKSKDKHRDSKKHSSKHSTKHGKDDKSNHKRSKSRDGERDGKQREHDRTKDGERGKDKDKGSSRSSHEKSREKDEQKKIKGASVTSKEKVGKDHKTTEQAAKDKETLECLKLSGQGNLMSAIGKIPKKNKISPDEGTAAITKPPGPPPPPKEKSFSILENRPKTKTVKTFNSKFRLTGLEEELQPPPPRVPRKPLPPPEKRPAEPSNPVVPNLKPKVPLPIKRSSPPPADSVPSEKRVRASLEELEKSAEDAKRIEKPGGIKLIAPKPKPAFLQESASFMDALTAGSRVEPRKRKRRNSSSKEGPEVKKDAGPSATPVATTPPSTPTKSPPTEEKPVISPTAAKPTFRFYQDTLETAEEEKRVNDEKKANEIKKENEEMIANEEKMTSEENQASEAKNASEQMQVVEEPEKSAEVEKCDILKEQNEAELQMEAENEQRTPTPPMEEEMDSPKPDNVEPQMVRSQPVYTTIHKKDGTAIRSVLVYHRGASYKKKSVKWKEEAVLEEVFLFELDETERTNVNRTFLDAKHLERIHEAQAFQLSRKIVQEDTMEEKTPWQMLIPINLDNIPNVDIGRNSIERDVQYAREKTVLPAIYYSRAIIPDYPADPDPEHHPMTDPVSIPLDDVTGNPESINDHRGTPWPEPKLALPRPPSPPGPHGFHGPPQHLGGPGLGPGPGPGMLDPGMNPMMMNMGQGPGLLGPGPMSGPLGGPGMGGPIMGGDWRAGDGTVYTGISNSIPDGFHGGPPHGMGMPDGGMPYPHDNGPPEVYMDERMMGPDDGMYMGPEEFPPGGPGMPFNFRGGPPHGMGGGGGGRGKMGPHGMGPRSGSRGPPRGGGFRGGPNRGGRGGQWQGNRGHPGGRDRGGGGGGNRGGGGSNRGVCKHFRSGFCRSGDNCPFLHQNAQMY